MKTLPNKGDIYSDSGRAFFCYDAREEIGLKSTMSIDITEKPSSKQHEISRLRHALSDFRNLGIAYPILAKYGLMERTINGYLCISPDAIERRCRELITTLQNE